MAKKTKKSKRSKRKQPDLPAMEGPGVEQKVIPEIDDLSDQYVDVRDRRMALTKQEVPAREALKTAMQKHGLQAYRYDGYLVTIKPGEAKIKVKRADEPEEEEEGIEISDD